LGKKWGWGNFLWFFLFKKEAKLSVFVIKGKGKFRKKSKKGNRDREFSLTTV